MCSLDACVATARPWLLSTRCGSRRCATTALSSPVRPTSSGASPCALCSTRYDMRVSGRGTGLGSRSSLSRALLRPAAGTGRGPLRHLIEDGGYPPDRELDVHDHLHGGNGDDAHGAGLPSLRRRRLQCGLPPPHPPVPVPPLPHSLSYLCRTSTHGANSCGTTTVAGVGARTVVRWLHRHHELR